MTEHGLCADGELCEGCGFCSTVGTDNEYDGYRWWLNKKLLYKGEEYIRDDGSIGFDLVGPTNKHHTVMLGVLFDIEFYALVPHDINRGHDGVALREEYLYFLTKNEKPPHGGSRMAQEWTGVPDDFIYAPNLKLFTAAERVSGVDLIPQGPARVLEVLIGIAQRMAFALDTDDIRGLFWELMSNLTMVGYNDETITFEKEALIRQKIDRVLSRNYRRNGKGGLFPLRQVQPEEYHLNMTAVKDQRNVEIAYQMDAYCQQKKMCQDSKDV